MKENNNLNENEEIFAKFIHNKEDGYLFYRWLTGKSKDLRVIKTDFVSFKIENNCVYGNNVLLAEFVEREYAIEYMYAHMRASRLIDIYYSQKHKGFVAEIKVSGNIDIPLMFFENKLCWVWKVNNKVYFYSMVNNSYKSLEKLIKEYLNAIN